VPYVPSDHTLPRSRLHVNGLSRTTNEPSRSPIPSRTVPAWDGIPKHCPRAQPNKSTLSSFCKSGPWKIRRLFANSRLAWYPVGRMDLQPGAPARAPSHLSAIKDPDRCPHCNSKLHTRPRKKFAEDGRLKAFGSGGRRQIAVVPCCSEHKLRPERLHSKTTT
jgi:DNA-directed RNA polymerase subunit RPC12/RpoP